MRKILQFLLQKPLLWMAEKLSSSPRKNEIFSSLSLLLQNIRDGKPGYLPPLQLDLHLSKIIILSDQHKGRGNSADDFVAAADNYRHVLRHYYDEQFTLVNLGDCEELWEASPSEVIACHRASLLEEARFQSAHRYHRVFGNHDLEWHYALQQHLYLNPLFGDDLAVHEGILFTTRYLDHDYEFFLTHGHQGDRRSDGNAFSKWFVAAIWTPLQRLLQIKLDTLSDSFELVDEHNILMYEWSATQKDLVFISGHTHKPVFASLDHIDRIARQIDQARSQHDNAAVEILQQELDRRKEEYRGKKIVKTMVRPSYFNTGCCCFSDGDLTGIEISNGFIRLVKWKKTLSGGERIVLEESPLFYLLEQLKHASA